MNENIPQLVIVFLLWRIKAIDSITVVQVFTNVGLQYTSLAVAEFATAKECSPRSIALAPMWGFAKGFKYVKTADKALEKTRRTYLFATFILISLAGVISDKATCVMIGGVLSSFISLMTGENRSK